MIKFLAVAGSALVVGCGPSEYQIGQTIEMGAFAFQVEKASSRVHPSPSEHVGPTRQISVQLRLLSNESRPRINFRAFLSGRETNCSGGISFSFGDRSRTKLEDSHGHKFSGGQNAHPCDPILAGKVQLVFRIESDRGFSTNEDFRAEHLDLRPEDFRLIITNPDRRKGQPSKIAIQF